MFWNLPEPKLKPKPPQKPKTKNKNKKFKNGEIFLCKSREPLRTYPFSRSPFPQALGFSIPKSTFQTLIVRIDPDSVRSIPFEFRFGFLQSDRIFDAVAFTFAWIRYCRDQIGDEGAVLFGFAAEDNWLLKSCFWLEIVSGSALRWFWR